MKENSVFNQLELMMLPSNARTLVFEDEFMLTDNFDTPVVEGDINQYVLGSSYPFKLMFNLVIFCTKGHMRIRVNITEYELTANDVLITLPNSIGECLELSQDCQLAILAYSGNSFSIDMDPSGAVQVRKFVTQNALIHLSKDDMDDFFVTYNQMRRKIQNKDYSFFKREVLMSYMQVLFCDGYNQMIANNNVDELHTESRQQIIFESFLAQVQKHYTKQRNINFYADILCITPKYLSQIIRMASGRYAGDWIRDYVILEAKAMLKSNKYTVQQVSDLLNFANASFFGKYFKAAVGCSPRKYQTGT